MPDVLPSMRNINSAEKKICCLVIIQRFVQETEAIKVAFMGTSPIL